jgi:Domain of unknown function (DUF4397)
MKRLFFLLLPALGVTVFFACKKQTTLVAKTSPVGSTAFIKIVHASPNFTTLYNVPTDSLNVYVGSEKITAAALHFGGGYPSPTSGNILGYATAPAGTQTIRVSATGVTNKDSLTVASFSENLVPGGYYTFVITDSVNTARDSSRIFVRDTYTASPAGPGYFYIRFIHAVIAGADTVDLYDPRRNQTLFSKIRRDSTTTFTNFPTTLGLPDTLYVRQTGTGTVLAKLNTYQFGDQQSFTAYYIGDTAVVTPTKPRTLIVLENK